MRIRTDMKIKKGGTTMKKRLMSFKTFRYTAVCLSAFFMASLVIGMTGIEVSAKDGKAVYEDHCISCHGANGDGKGAGAPDLLVQPRNFTLGVYKFKTTMGNSIPTDADLKKSIHNGLHGSSMPNFRLLTDEEKNDLVTYIKSFSQRFVNEKPGKTFAAPKIPGFVGTDDSMKKGAQIFAKKCQMCHGTKENIPDVKFALMWPGDKGCSDMIRPADFTGGAIKRGTKVEDIYMSITAGVENTPMIAFANQLSEDDRWNLVSYILDFMGKGGK